MDALGVATGGRSGKRIAGRSCGGVVTLKASVLCQRVTTDIATKGGTFLTTVVRPRLKQTACVAGT